MWKCRDCRSCGKAMDNSKKSYPQLYHNRLDNALRVTHNHLNNSWGVIHITTTPVAIAYRYKKRKERRNFT